MPLRDPILFCRIHNHEFPFRIEVDYKLDERKMCMSFKDNLRQAGDWTESSATRLVQEYRRFLYLKAVVDGDLTSSQWLDEVWHLHRSMGEDFGLRKILGRDLTRRNDMSKQEILTNYAKTISYYRQEFDEEPPQDIWPDANAIRKAPIWTMVSSIYSGLFLVGSVVCGIIPESVVQDSLKFTVSAIGLLGALFVGFEIQKRIPTGPPKEARSEPDNGGG